jgi:hypothetical protein
MGRHAAYSTGVFQVRLEGNPVFCSGSGLTLTFKDIFEIMKNQALIYGKKRGNEGYFQRCQMLPQW